MRNPDLEGEDTSLWIATTPTTHYPQLSKDERIYKVIIIGGGITGLATAWQLQREGRSVVLIDKARIVEWTTGETTAKLTSQHYLIYRELIDLYGKETAQAFADANERGLKEVGTISEKFDIDSDYSRQDAYVYTENEDRVEEIKAEVEAAQSLGLPASFTADVDLPVKVAGAIRFSDQAQFHPRKFLLAIAERFVRDGGVIYENTEATDIVPGKDGEPTIVKTKQGDLKGESVVVASGNPFWKKEIFADSMWTKISYDLGVLLSDESEYPNGMYITTDEPLRTTRSHPYEGGKILIFGGESHEYDEDSFDPPKHYEVLIKEVSEKYDVEKVVYRWLAEDMMPYDRKPYIGRYPGYDNIYVSTGYRAWGLAWAMTAAHIITNKIMGRDTAWADPFDSRRVETERKLSEEEKESLKTH